MTENLYLASTAGNLFLLEFAGAFYLLPGIVGQMRHHHQRKAIWVLNIFLGWTMLGWVAALIWAATATRMESPKQA